ncbi:MAG: SLBB domain-containing protein [Pyrinomonadaceae bacterium]|nr:SLBB domain-containing protein [Pyrinomonadaceae bacterium]
MSLYYQQTRFICVAAIAIFATILSVNAQNKTTNDKKSATTATPKQTNPEKSVDANETPSTNTTEETLTTPAQTIVTTTTPQISGDAANTYLIGIGDQLDIQVFNQPKYSKSVRVTENGFISLPRIDQPIQTLCKSENQLSTEIAGYYAKYLRQPYVSVFVKEYKSQPVAVIGAVEKPGQFYINHKTRLLEAIALAGGPTTKAGTRIQVARLGKANLCEKKADEFEEEVDLSKLLSSYNLRKTINGDEKANPFMQPGDIISILEADQIYVVGNVKDPKTILLKETKTLTSAINEAGGMLPLSRLKQIKLVRQTDDGKREETIYDYNAIAKRQVDDPILQANDVIDVPIDGAKKTRDKIITALTSGLSSLPFLIPR